MMTKQESNGHVSIVMIVCVSWKIRGQSVITLTFFNGGWGIIVQVICTSYICCRFTRSIQPEMELTDLEQRFKCRAVYFDGFLQF
jgi:hypothetical protein